MKDVLRSWVRQAALSAQSRVLSRPMLQRLTSAVKGFAEQKRVPEADIATRVARLPDVTASTVRIAKGEIRVQVDMADRSHAFTLLPESVRFAPRGSKELRFRVSPADAPRSIVNDVAGAIAAAVAGSLFAFLLRGDDDRSGLGEREGAQVVVDLRTVPAVAKILRNNQLGQLIDLLDLQALEAVDGALALKSGMFGMARGS